MTDRIDLAGLRGRATLHDPESHAMVGITEREFAALVEAVEAAQAHLDELTKCERCEGYEHAEPLQNALARFR